MNFSFFNSTNTTSSPEAQPRFLAVSLVLIGGVALVTLFCCLRELTRSAQSSANHDSREGALNEKDPLNIELTPSRTNLSEQATAQPM